MGIKKFFKNLSHADGPKPHVQVIISGDQDKVYKPGDCISGVVQFTTPKKAMFETLEVYIRGTSKVWIRKSTSSTNSTTNTSSTDYYHYRDNVELFRHTIELFSKQEQEAGTYTYPFSFIITDRAEVDRTGAYDKPPDDVYIETPHLLPPSFHFGPEDNPDQAKVTYGVSARLLYVDFHDDSHSSKKKDDGLEQIESEEAEYLFQPLNPNAHIRNVPYQRRPKHFELISSVLSDIDPESIGFRQKVRDKFSKHTPILDFELGVEFPTLLKLGREFDIRVTFHVLGKKDNVVTIPPLNFIIEKLEIVDFTFFRAPRDWDASNNMSGSPMHRPRKKTKFRGDDESIYEEGRQKVALNSLPGHHFIELPESMMNEEKKRVEQRQDCEVWFQSRVPANLESSFQSYAIARAYRVRVKLLVEFGGKKFKFDAEGPDAPLGIE